MQKLETEESCRRLARAISSDIKLYEEKHLQQLRKGLPMPPELAAAIADGQKLFLSRAAPEFSHLFDEAFQELTGVVLNTSPPAAATRPVLPTPTPAPVVQAPAIPTPIPAPAIPTPTPAPVILPDAAVAQQDVPNDTPIEQDRRPASEASSVLSKVAITLLAAVLAALIVYFLMIR